MSFLVLKGLKKSDIKRRSGIESGQNQSVKFVASLDGHLEGNSFILFRFFITSFLPSVPKNVLYFDALFWSSDYRNVRNFKFPCFSIPVQFIDTLLTCFHDLMNKWQ